MLSWRRSCHGQGNLGEAMPVGDECIARASTSRSGGTAGDGRLIRGMSVGFDATR